MKPSSSEGLSYNPSCFNTLRDAQVHVAPFCSPACLWPRTQTSQAHSGRADGCVFALLMLLTQVDTSSPGWELCGSSMAVLLRGKTHLLGRRATPTQLFSFWTETVHVNARAEPGLRKCLSTCMLPLRHRLLTTCSVPGTITKEELLSVMDGYFTSINSTFFSP